MIEIFAVAIWFLSTNYQLETNLGLSFFWGIWTISLLTCLYILNTLGTHMMHFWYTYLCTSHKLHYIVNVYFHIHLVTVYIYRSISYIFHKSYFSAFYFLLLLLYPSMCIHIKDSKLIIQAFTLRSFRLLQEKKTYILLFFDVILKLSSLCPKLLLKCQKCFFWSEC